MDRRRQRTATPRQRFGAIRCATLCVTLVTLSISPRGYAQRTRSVQFKVARCEAGDALIGQAERDVKGEIRGYYDPAKDETFVSFQSRAAANDLPSFVGLVSLSGRSPDAEPEVELTAMTRGAFARSLLDAEQPPSTVLVLDDSTAQHLGAVQIGQYHGPRDAAVVPLTVRLPYLLFLAAARARKVEMEVGDRVLRWDGRMRDNVHALFYAAVCPQRELPGD